MDSHNAAMELLECNVVRGRSFLMSNIIPKTVKMLMILIDDFTIEKKSDISFPLISTLLILHRETRGFKSYYLVDYTPKLLLR